MIGPLLAVLTAISFGLHGVFLRRAVLKVSKASLGILITVPMSVPLFFFILVFTGQIRSILYFSWQNYVWFSLAGIFHFVVGRTLAYQCVQLVGANIASLLRRINILVAVVVGVSLLHEPLSWQLAIGVFLIIAGISIAGSSHQALRNSDGQFSKIPTKAFVLGFGCGVAWGLSPIFVKLGLKGSGSPIAGAFIAFVAATVVLSISLANRTRRSSIVQIIGPATGLFLIAGLLSFTAHLFRFLALNLTPASVVSPIISTSPVFLLVFSFLFNRKMEIFSRPVIIGAAMVVVGTIILV
ncbi:EamA family transporter [Thermodesulfobacteriota bacterium]